MNTEIIIFFFLFKMHAVELGLLPGKGFQVIFHFKDKGKHFVFRIDCSLAKFESISADIQCVGIILKKKKRKL